MEFSSCLEINIIDALILNSWILIATTLLFLACISSCKSSYKLLEKFRFFFLQTPPSIQMVYYNLVIHLVFLLSLFLHTSSDIEIQFMSRNSLTVISITNKDSFFNSIQDQCFDDDLHSYWHGGKKKKLYPLKPCSRVLQKPVNFANVRH